MVIMMVCVHYTCEWGGVYDGDGVGNEWYACCVCVCVVVVVVGVSTHQQ
jgi:hypothetical protein